MSPRPASPDPAPWPRAIRHTWWSPSRILARSMSPPRSPGPERRVGRTVGRDGDSCQSRCWGDDNRRHRLEHGRSDGHRAHPLATSSLADDNGSNNSIGIAINVMAPGPPGPPPPPRPPPPGTGRRHYGHHRPRAREPGRYRTYRGHDKERRWAGRHDNFDVVYDRWVQRSNPGHETIAGLAVGASVTRTFDWNTAASLFTGHPLFASVSARDSDPANNTSASV